MKPIRVFIHTDGRRIEVYPQGKVRYSGKPHAASMIRAGDTADEWPVLKRSDVPHLSDDEWYAHPGEGWTMIEV